MMIYRKVKTIWKRAKVNERFLSSCVSHGSRSTSTHRRSLRHFCHFLAEEEDDDAEGEVEGEVEDEEDDA